MDTLEQWAQEVRGELGLDLDEATEKTVLNLTRVVAHQVDRPAAPLTAYYLGVAVGRGEPLADAAARIQQLARAWHAQHAGPEEPPRHRA
jgi:Domain of unknown function (DUF6457)